MVFWQLLCGKKRTLQQEAQETISIAEKIQEIPEDLLCSICNDVFTDAVMIPCCGSSFCDDCVRTALLESEDNECPDCNEKGSSPGSLIPNRFLRNSVNAFKNESGYKDVQLKKVLQDDEASSVLNKSSEIVDSVPKNDECSEDKIETVEELLEHPVSDEKVPQLNLNDETIKESKAESPKNDDIESDFEDNITVTMPTAQMENQHAVFLDRPFNGSNTRHPKPPGIESSPRNQLQISPLHSHRDPNPNSPRAVHRPERDRDCDRERGRDYPEYISEPPYMFDKASNLKQHNLSTQPLNNGMQHFSHGDIRDRNVRSIHEMYAGSGHRMNVYQQVPMHPQISQGPPMANFNNMYNPMGHRTGVGYPHYIRPHFNNSNSGFMSMRGESRQNLSQGSLASVYQGVAAKVGTGIIDDPLEAFNRIMKEKEKRKEERRRSPDHRRSRSAERLHRRFHVSPYDRRAIREPPREKRLRSREKERRREREHEIVHDREKTFRRRRSNSFSDRSSRSRSWSNSPLKKRSKSPIRGRRSHSRTQNLGEKSRQLKKARSDHRDDEFRPESPKKDMRRSRSRGRSYGQHSNWYPPINATSTISGDFSDKSYKKDMSRFPHNRSTTPQSKREVHSGKHFKRFENSSHETLEPPPPGFEAIQSLHSSHWTNSKQEQNKLMRSTTPDLYEKYLTRDFESHEIRDNHPRTERSWSGSSTKSFERKRKRTGSITPPSQSFTLHSEKPGDIVHKKPSLSVVSLKHKEREKLESIEKKSEKDRKNGKELKRERHKEKQCFAKDKSNSRDVSRDISEKTIKKSSTSEKQSNEEWTNKLEKETNQVSNRFGLNKEKEKVISKYSGKEDKTDKKLKERKKKRKDKEKYEKKKLKKDKKEKREREKQKNTVESESESKKDVTPCEEDIIEQDQRMQLVNNLDDEDQMETPELNFKTENLILERRIEDRQQLNDSFLVSEIEQQPQPAQIESQIDYLYGDICEEGELNDNESQEKAKGETTPPSEFKRFDSVLDIHCYETDFDELNYLEKKNKILPAVPEPSKWERDEQSTFGVHCNAPILAESEQLKSAEEVGDKVTNEVLRKAENAIFARAINAIRPIDIKKISTDVPKLSCTESKPILSKVYHESSKDKMKSFQITVPTSSSQERSVEIKGETRKRTRSPKLVSSIKDRLGSKVVNKIRISPHKILDNKRHKSRSLSRDKHSLRSDVHQKERDKERDRYKNVDRNRERDSDRNREREIDRNRERDSDRNRERDRLTNNRSGESGKRDHKLRLEYNMMSRMSDEHLKNRQSSSSQLSKYNRNIEKSREKISDQHKDSERNTRDYELKKHHTSSSECTNKRDNKSKEKIELETDRKTLDERIKKETSVVPFAVLKSSHDQINKNKNIENSGNKEEPNKKEQLLTADSSSQSSNTETESDSDDPKRKKKRKNKKDKKRSRRSSSTESTGSTKKKHIKNKKRNKSSKKKKKSKK